MKAKLTDPERRERNRLRSERYRRAQGDRPQTPCATAVDRLGRADLPAKEASGRTMAERAEALVHHDLARCEQRVENFAWMPQIASICDILKVCRDLASLPRSLRGVALNYKRALGNRLAHIGRSRIEKRQKALLLRRPCLHHRFKRRVYAIVVHLTFQCDSSRAGPSANTRN